MEMEKGITTYSKKHKYPRLWRQNREGPSLPAALTSVLSTSLTSIPQLAEKKSIEKKMTASFTAISISD